MLQGGQLGEYEIVTKISHGTFGQVFIVHSSKTNERFAAKIESLYIQHNTIELESKVLKSLQKSNYFPQYITSGKNSHFIYYIIELLGPSLAATLTNLQIPKFSLSTSLRIAYHMLNAIEFMHNCGYLHRDIKPGNILINEKSQDYPVKLIDFGLSRCYIDRKTKKQLKPRKQCGFRGTLAYASVHAHLNEELSPRDDLISLFYVITDLLTANLPWRNLNDKDEVLRLKQNCSFTALLSPLAPELLDIWHLINNLQYFEKPNYQRIRSLLLDTIHESNIEMNSPYDWAIKKRLELRSLASKDQTIFSDNSEFVVQIRQGCCLFV